MAEFLSFKNFRVNILNIYFYQTLNNSLNSSSKLLILLILSTCWVFNFVSLWITKWKYRKLDFNHSWTNWDINQNKIPYFWMYIFSNILKSLFKIENINYDTVNFQRVTSRDSRDLIVLSGYYNMRIYLILFFSNWISFGFFEVISITLISRRSSK